MTFGSSDSHVIMYSKLIYVNILPRHKILMSFCQYLCVFVLIQSFYFGKFGIKVNSCIKPGQQKHMKLDFFFLNLL